MKKVVIVGGVSGCGKSTFCKNFNASQHIEGDAFHSIENIQKMKSGVGLDDDDRNPWLDSIIKEISASDSQKIIVSCSVLKKKYRDRFREKLPDVELVFIILNPEKEVIIERLLKRQGHFATLALLKSQYLDLELPGNDEPDCEVI